MAAQGEPAYGPYLAEGLAQTLRLDSGTGLTYWTPNRFDGDSVVDVAGVPPLNRGEIVAAERLARAHPVLSRPELLSAVCSRVSDVVALPRFWDTEIWRALHGPGNGRYPAVVGFGRYGEKIVFLGMYRTDRDFTDEEIQAVAELQAPMRAALTFRHELESAVARVRSRYGDVEDSRATLAAVRNRCST